MVKPWLTSYWPQERQRNTARTADEMVKIIMESGSAFPDAVSWSLDVRAVQPIRRLLRLHRLLEPGYYHIDEYPDAVLRLLDGVVKEDPVMNGDRALILQPILDALEVTNPSFLLYLLFPESQFGHHGNVEISFDTHCTATPTLTYCVNFDPSSVQWYN